MIKDRLKIMLVAGEESGDELGAKLVLEIRRIAPESEFFGVTGPRMRNVGVESIFDSDQWSITGILPVARAVPRFVRRIRKLKNSAIERRPDAVVLIDFPEFNLKLAKSMKKLGETVIYYVSPQLWAWRKYRVRTIRKYVDLLISILPFESEWYAKNDVRHVEFVGNPIVEKIRPNTERKDFCLKHGLDPERPIIALLPGSRSREIRYHLPLMIETAIRMLESRPELQFVVAVSSSSDLADIGSTISAIVGDSANREIIAVQNETFDALFAAQAAAIASGTATLAAGVIGTPMAIVYKMSKLDSAILGSLLGVENIGLINLVAGRCVAKEFLQNEFTAENLSKELFRLLDPETNSQVRLELARICATLTNGASRKAAEKIVRLATSKT